MHIQCGRHMAAAALAAAAGLAHAGTSYYVAPGGSDANPGTLAQPWLTVGHAANVLKAGQTAYVRAGVYHESVTIAHSGDASAGPVTLQAYPGEKPVLDGTGVACCGDTIKGLVNIADKSHVVVSGFEIRNFKSGSASQEPAGILVTGSGADIRILGNDVHDIVTTKEASNGNAHGIGVYGTGATPISGLVLSGNEVHALKTGWSESVTLDGNVTGFTVTGNVVHDNDNIGIDMAGFWGVGPSGHDQASGGTVSGNTVYGITSLHNAAYGGVYGADGIYCDGCANVVIERNAVYANDLNIEAASENAGHVSSGVTIRDNLLRDPNVADLSIGGYSKAVGGSDHVTIVNNTIYDTAAAPGNAFQVQWKATNNVFENNIVYSDSAGGNMLYTVGKPATAPVAMDHNLYYTTAKNATWVWSGKTYTGLGSFQLGTGQDAHSSFADPLFASLSAPDLHVARNSPAVGRGVDLGAAVVGTQDYAGNARVIGSGLDIGAYEQ